MIGDILQPTHLLFILAVALLVLGPKRLPEVGRALGRGLRDFRSALSTDDMHDQMIGPTSADTEIPPDHEQTVPLTPAEPAPASPVEAPATKASVAESSLTESSLGEPSSAEPPAAATSTDTGAATARHEHVSSGPAADHTA